MERNRRLWAAVLVQAIEDLEREEFQSYWWNHAAAFFVSDGEWAESRRTICDMLDLHPSDLRRPALRIINARRMEHGLPPLQTQAPTPCLPKQRVLPPVARREPLPPLPRLVATFAPDNLPDQPAPGPRNWRRRYAFNPFAPLPSEVNPAGSAAD